MRLIGGWQMVKRHVAYVWRKERADGIRNGGSEPMVRCHVVARLERRSAKQGASWIAWTNREGPCGADVDSYWAEGKLGLKLFWVASFFSFWAASFFLNSSFNFATFISLFLFFNNTLIPTK
uniref:Uncharacterized protein n=1 Tax=Cannabis sativa TaxID=3483 RepID=A0A803NL29_CANSA